MKVMTNFVKYMMVVLLSLFIFSCSDGEDGARGPAGQNGVDGVDGVDGQDGTDGVDGQDGVDGTDGQDGADGETGTANVIYSDWIPENFNAFPGTIKTMILVDTSDQDFDRNIDVVLVYGRASSETILPPGIVYELPYYNVEGEEFYTNRITQGLSSLGSPPQQSIIIEAQSTDGADKDFEFFSDFRYVIIPGGVAIPSSAASKSSEDYKNMSYKEILSIFKIPE